MAVLTLSLFVVPGQVDESRTLQWFSDEANAVPAIARHHLNDRRQGSVRNRYKKGILQHGIMNGCRGECWVTEHLECTMHTFTQSVLAFEASESRGPIFGNYLWHAVRGSFHLF